MKNSKAILSIDNNDKHTKTNLNLKYNHATKTMINHEELVGGCCVCSDDQGFSNNALVYCDGKGCTVACHTACYGIVSIPDDDWYCRRCEAGEIQAPCRLCPMVEGAMKRTSDGNWAHVICALYIPEVSFGNDSTMEPIILSEIPSTRFKQTCSICLKKGRSNSDAMKGACCECTAKNCSQVFHVTCAQQAGLLYEDVRKNNCQYPIYCEQHQPKFSKFIRQIPAFQYKSSGQKHNLKEKVNPSQLSDFVNPTGSQTNRLLASEKRQKLNDETSQNSSQGGSLTNLSQFVELNKEEGNSQPSSSHNQSIGDNSGPPIDNSKSSSADTEQQPSTSICTNTTSNDNNNLPSKKTVTPKIKTEENDRDYQIIEKGKHNKDEQSRKKRQHSTEGVRRPVGRPPSKKTLLSQQKTNTNPLSLKAEESPAKNDQIHIDFYPRRPLNNSSATQQQRLFPPQTLEEFLEQEWESSSDFLLQQTMPHDVSSLLSCLYQFKSENASLQKTFDELKHRRDSLRVTNANLRRKLSEIIPINDAQRLPINSQQIIKTSKSPSLENQRKLTQITSSEMDFFSNNSTSSSSSLSYEPINPFTMIKNERIPPTNGLSLELLSQILATSGPQLFAPTWNISNFGYANFPGASSISLSDESIIRSYPSFDQ